MEFNFLVSPPKAVTFSRHAANAGGFYIVRTFLRRGLTFPSRTAHPYVMLPGPL